MTQAGTTVIHPASALGISSDPRHAELRAEDAAFVAELQSGSEDAFSRLIELYHHPIFSLVVRSLRDPADAADITQEIFLKVYRGIRNFHGESSLRTWIYRIALHETSNQRRWWLRHKRREIAIEADASGRNPEDFDTQPIADSLQDTRPSPFDLAAQKELNAAIAFALSRVPEVFRNVLILREIEGFAYDEIAAVLNIQTGTVKSRLMRGRQSLRTALAELNSPHLPQLQVARSSPRADSPAPLPSLANLSPSDISDSLHALVSHVEQSFHIDPRTLASPPAHHEEAAL